jgi:hypothetical protein
MAHDRRLQHLQRGISRAIASNYYDERDIPKNLQLLLGRLSVLDDQPNATYCGLKRSDRSSETSAMTDRAVRRELDRYLDQVGAYLPDWLCRTVKWLRKPERVIARIIVSLLLFAGGLLWFLPVLGLWMLPLALILISQDLPFLQRPLVRIFRWTERQWHKWRDRSKK